MNVTRAFSERLKELRGDMSQTELAEKLGVSRGSISYYENADRVPDIEFLEKVALFFDVSSDYLLGKTNAKNIEGDKNSAINYTGLDEMAISSLHEEKEEGYGALLGHLSALLCNSHFWYLLHDIDRAWIKEYCEYGVLNKELRKFIRENNLNISEKTISEKGIYSLTEEQTAEFREALARQYIIFEFNFHDRKSSRRLYEYFLIQNDFLNVLEEVSFELLYGSKIPVFQSDLEREYKNIYWYKEGLENGEHNTTL